MRRTAFFGSPWEAVPVLGALASVSRVEVVVSQPDRPKGRGRKVAPPAVAVAAASWGFPVARSVHEARDRLGEIDVAVVTAYGRLIPPDVLALPRRGFVNVHFSLLPRWRGASPVVRAILAGDERTGVTLMQMDAGLDTGPIIEQEEVVARAWDTAGTLTARIAARGADLLARRLDAIAAGSVVAYPQDESGATGAGKVTVEEAHVDPARHSAEAVDRAVRAFDPRPGAWSTVEGARIKIWSVEHDEAVVEAGTARLVEGRVVLGAVGGSLRLLRVQPEGKPVMDAAAWMHGRRGAPAVFGG